MPRIVKIKWVKGFYRARNQISVGEVLEENDRYLRVKCRSFNFGKISYGLGNIHINDEFGRVIPWESIQLFYELPEDTDWHAPLAFDESSCVILDNAHKTLITDTRIPGDFD